MMVKCVMHQQAGAVLIRLCHGGDGLGLGPERADRKAQRLDQPVIPRSDRIDFIRVQRRDDGTMRDLLAIVQRAHDQRLRLHSA